MSGEPAQPATTLEEVIERIARSENVWVRVASGDDNNGTWRVRLLDFVAGPEPPGWTARQWVYPNACFEASVQTGQAVSDWIRAGALPVGGRDLGPDPF